MPDQAPPSPVQAPRISPDPAQSAAADSCVICLLPQSENQAVVKCGTCKKSIHVQCAMQLQDTRCPNCRTEIFNRPPGNRGPQSMRPWDYQQGAPLRAPRALPVYQQGKGKGKGKGRNTDAFFHDNNEDPDERLMLQDIAPITPDQQSEQELPVPQPELKMSFAPGVKMNSNNPAGLIGLGVVSITVPDPHLNSESDDAPFGSGVDIVALLDISGSMAGAKLDQTKNTLQFLIGELSDFDRLSMVTFESQAKIISQLTPMTNQRKSAAKRLAQGLQHCGGTDIGLGLRKVADVLNNRRWNERTTCILLMSDGCTNRPESSYINQFKSKLRDPSQVRISCFGYGADHDSRLMADLASQNEGSYQFMENPHDFASAVSIVLTQSVLGVAIKNSSFTLSSRNDGTVVKVVKDGSARVGDLVFGARRDILFYVCKSAQESDAHATFSVGDSVTIRGIPQDSPGAQWNDTRVSIVNDLGKDFCGVQNFQVQCNDDKISIPAKFLHKASPEVFSADLMYTAGGEAQTTRVEKVRIDDENVSSEEYKLVLLSKFRLEVAAVLKNESGVTVEQQKQSIEALLTQIRWTCIRDDPQTLPLLESCEGTLRRLRANDRRATQAYTFTASHSLMSQTPSAAVHSSPASWAPSTIRSNRHTSERASRATTYSMRGSMPEGGVHAPPPYPPPPAPPQ